MTPNASEVCFTDAGGVLKAEAKQPIEADMRHPNQGKTGQAAAFQAARRRDKARGVKRSTSNAKPASRSAKSGGTPNTSAAEPAMKHHVSGIIATIRVRPD